MPDFTKNDRKLCDYGCGQQAKFQFKNGKWCCEDDCHKCVEFKKRYEGKNNPSYGVSPSKETREKISKGNKGKKCKPFTIEHRRKISKANKGNVSPKKGKSYGEYYGKEKAEEIRKKREGKTYKEIMGEEKAIERRRKISKNHADVSGKNNPNWKGGISCEPYCDVWLDKEYKQSIKKRDNYTCQNCGITGMLSLKVYGINLHIHHINYNKKACHPENLITICRSCNSKANFNRCYWKVHYQSIILGGGTSGN